MTIEEYTREMRMNRGRLTSMTDQIKEIYTFASAAFAAWILKDKAIGIEKAVHIMDQLTRAEQTTLVSFIESQTPRLNIDGIELKVSKIIADR